MSNEAEVVGELTVGEMRTLDSLREQASAITRDIGTLEIRKASLVTAYSDLDVQAKVILEGAARRIGIPEGERWSVSLDGKFHKVTP